MSPHSLLALAFLLASVAGQDPAFVNQLRQQGFNDQQIQQFFREQQAQGQQQQFQAQGQFGQQQQQQPQFGQNQGGFSQQGFPPQTQQFQQGGFQQPQGGFQQPQGGFQQPQGGLQQQQGGFQQQQGGFQQQQGGFQQQGGIPQQGGFQQQGGFPQQNVQRVQQQQPQQPQQQLPPRSKVFFDIEVDNGQRKESYGRITMELFDEVVPRTARNFLEIASGQNPQGFTYRGTIFHRIIPQFMLQGGDFERFDGTGGQSIYGPKFDDENFLVKHGSPGLLSMANSGPNTNGAQFFITTVKTDWLDGKHVVFGRVDDQASFDIVKRIEALGSASGKPSATVTVTNSGVLETGCCCVADLALRCGA